MHKDYTRANTWSEAVIGAAIEVHRQKGPGLLEELMNAPLGLLINFHSVVLKGGICRLILHGADSEDVDF